MRYIKNIAKCLFLLNYVLCMDPNPLCVRQASCELSPLSSAGRSATQASVQEFPDLGQQACRDAAAFTGFEIDPRKDLGEFIKNIEARELCEKCFNGDIANKLFENNQDQELFPAISPDTAEEEECSDFGSQASNESPIVGTVLLDDELKMKYKMIKYESILRALYIKCISDYSLIDKLTKRHFASPSFHKKNEPQSRGGLETGSRITDTSKFKGYPCIFKNKMLIILSIMYALLSILFMPGKIILVCILVIFIVIYCLNMLFLRWNAENIHALLVDMAIANFTQGMPRARSCLASADTQWRSASASGGLLRRAVVS